jgi:hypothetical protein
MIRERKLNRLKGYDYASAGCYFVTVCVDDKGRVSDKGRAWEPARTRVEAMTLSDVMHRFKSLTTKLYRRDFLFNDRSAIRVGLWKRSFYDRIIRDGREHVMIREYIQKNPMQWSKGDQDHKDGIHAGVGAGSHAVEIKKGKTKLILPVNL